MAEIIPPPPITPRTGSAIGALTPMKGRRRQSVIGGSRIAKLHSGQYYAGNPVGPRVGDIATDLRRVGVRVAVGMWELNMAFKHAIDADDEMRSEKRRPAARRL